MIQKVIKVVALATLFDIASTEIYLGVRDYVVPDDTDITVHQMINFECLRWYGGYRVCPTKEIPI